VTRDVTDGGDADVMDDQRAVDLKWFEAFVATSRWQFAKTYVESYPHEYTVDRWGDPADVAQAGACIERWGVPESFWSSTRKYLYVGERKYWHMEDLAAAPNAAVTLINRTWVDVTRYRADARALGYDDDALEQLAQRWVTLLQRAREGR
jgi:hypothetical protein